MKISIHEVMHCLDDFLTGKSSFREFSTWYFRAMSLQDELRPREESEILNEIWMDLDAFRAGGELTSDLTIDEKELKVRLKRHLNALRTLEPPNEVASN